MHTRELGNFLETAEEQGAVEEAALEALAFEHDLDEDELAGLRAELEALGVEITPVAEDASASTAETTYEPGPGGTTDSLTRFMNEIGRYAAADRGPGGRAREADRARRSARRRTA